MSNDAGIKQEELHAFLDGELDPARTAEIAKLVATDGALARQVAAFRSDKEQLGKIYGALDALPVPSQWMRQVEDHVPQPPSPATLNFSRRSIIAAGASAAAVLALWVGYRQLAAPAEDTIVDEAFAAREDKMAAEQTFDSAALSTAESRNRTVSGALALMLKAPDLMKLGYQLARVRIFSGRSGGKAVELGYRNAQNTLFTLYLRHPSGPARVDLLQRDGIRICVWQDEVLGTVMLGEMSAGEMARMASLAYSGLTI